MFVLSRDGVCKLQVYVTIGRQSNLHFVTKKFCELVMATQNKPTVLNFQIRVSSRVLLVYCAREPRYFRHYSILYSVNSTTNANEMNRAATSHLSRWIALKQFPRHNVHILQNHLLQSYVPTIQLVMEAIESECKKGKCLLT